MVDFLRVKKGDVLEVVTREEGGEETEYAEDVIVTGFSKSGKEILCKVIGGDEEEGVFMFDRQTGVEYIGEGEEILRLADSPPPL